MKKLNIGIVGTGGMAKIHTTAYMKNPATFVYGVCSISRELSEAFAAGDWGTVAYSEGELKAEALYRIDHIYDSYEEMATDPAIDAVSIVVPNALHYPIAKLMLENNKHVMMEKPLALNGSMAAELVALARKKNLLLASGHMWRYHKEVAFLKQCIEQGMLGDIVQTKSYGLHLQWAPGGWFAKKSEAGGGALIDMGVHAIDTTRYLIGEPKTVSVYASIGTKFGEYDVDDFAQIMVKHDNGVVSLFEAGWNFPYISGLEASTEIWGTKGYARLFPTSLTVKTADQWGTITMDEIEPHTSTEPYNRQIDDFVDGVLGRSKCKVAYEVGLEVLRICDAAYLSSEQDILVKL